MVKDPNFCLSFKGSCLRPKNITFTPPDIINFFILYKLDTQPQDLNSDFTLKDCLFGGVKLTKNVDQGKYIILVMILDLIHVLNFHYLTVAWVKMSLI